MRSKWLWVSATEVVSPDVRDADICAAVFFIILLHQEFVERESVDLLVQGPQITLALE